MDVEQMRAAVADDLKSYPRGPRGSDQNMFRAALAAARLNSLGRDPHLAPSVEAARELALRIVRQTSADFEPQVA
jgi:hypothetical protein